MLDFSLGLFMLNATRRWPSQNGLSTHNSCGSFLFSKSRISDPGVLERIADVVQVLRSVRTVLIRYRDFWLGLVNLDLILLIDV